MSTSSVVGVGAGIGALFLCAACFILFQIYRRKREHNREIAEIEQGFPPTHPVEVTQAPALGTCQLPFVPSYVPCGGWGALASTETVYRLPAFAQVNSRTHPAFVFPEEQQQPRPGWSFPGKRPRIGRMPSQARRSQALSAIIESPRGTPNGRSRNSPAAVKGGAAREQDGQSGSVEQLIAKPEVTVIDSPQIPPRSISRPIQLTDIPPPAKALTRRPSRPRAARSKSLGTVSDPNKPNRTSTFAAAPGPAPTGPLPPLPPLPRNISRHSDYDPANRHSALGIPSSKHNDSASTSLNSSPERNWERIISTENINTIPEYKTSKQKDVAKEVAAEGGAEATSNNGDSRPPSSLGHRRSLVCLSITSNGSNRNSCSSLASTLERQANRLSIPQIMNVDRISMSRVSSSDSLNCVISTPRRRDGSSRVSASGSPSEKPRSSALRAVSGNAGSPQRPMKTCLKASTADLSFKWEKTMLSPKHSILKGSPGARRGHRRQNCVRLSTLAPTVWGPRSRSTSPSPMDEIVEESPGHRNSPVAEKHLNGDVTLRPRAGLDPLRLRASLTPSSPTLSMVAYQQESFPWNDESNSEHASYVSRSVDKGSLSREGSLFSIPSLPSMSHVGQDEDARQGSGTPAIDITRPSTEWSENERTPPFGLRVTPSNSKHSLYHSELSPLPSWSRKYDPSWPMLEYNPPASGQEYDPNRPVSVYSSDGEEESSSPNFPFAVKEEEEEEEEAAAPTYSSPPSFLFAQTEDAEWGEDEKENDTPSKPAGQQIQRMRSPFEQTPVLRPHAALMQDLDPSLPSPPPSPSSSICKTPPLLCRAFEDPSMKSAETSPSSSIRRQHHRRRSSSASPTRHTSTSRIEKPALRTTKRMTGPRMQPPKDVRKSIMALRRMNSSLDADEDGGQRRYLRLGREASPDLPFGFESRVGADSDDDPPKDIRLAEDKEESRQCHLTAYAAAKPVLRLLTTVPEAPRSRLSVWDAGESYWEHQERKVQEAVTASPVDTPTTTLDRMLGYTGPGAQQQQQQAAKEEGMWDKRSKAVETPKSVHSYYDQQGFYMSP